MTAFRPISETPTGFERLLRMSDVVEMTVLSRATIYRHVAAGTFLAPVKIAGAARWQASAVARFIEALTSANEGNRK
jgi:predicted DNA-binding transcriptional regulator AlpA